MAKQKTFSLFEFLFSLIVAAGLFYWLWTGLVDGELILPNPRPSIDLDPVRMHETPFSFLFWTALIGGFGVYFLYLALREVGRLIRKPAQETEDPDTVVTVTDLHSDTIHKSVSSYFEIEITDIDEEGGDRPVDDRS